MVVCPGKDLDLARAAVQFEREDRAGSCAAAEFFQTHPVSRTRPSGSLGSFNM